MYISTSPKDSSQLDLIEKIVSGETATKLNSTEFARLAKQFLKYDPIATVARLSGLLTVPSFQANNLRLEILVHLAVAQCRGDRKPGIRTIENWCNGYLGSTSAVGNEDPVEDVFVTNVETGKGNLRLFQGTRESNDYFAQALVDILSYSNGPARWRRLHESVVALLLICDCIAERVGLERWHSELSDPGVKIEINPSIGIIQRAHAVSFADDDLDILGINHDVLAPFFLEPDSKNLMLNESLGHTTLERFPIIRTGDGFVLTLPHAVSRAIRRFAISEIQCMGDMHLFSEILASYQADHIEQYGLLEFSRNEKLPLTSEKLELPIVDWLYKYDSDKIVHVVFIQDCMNRPDPDYLDSLFVFSKKEVTAIQDYLSQTADDCMNRPDTAEGTTVFVIGGLGSGIVFGFEGFPQGWRYSVIPIHDLLMMAYEFERTVSRYLKFLKQKKWIEEKGVEFVEIVGDYGLFCLWRESDYQLARQNLPLESGSQLCIIHSPVFTARIKQRRNLDRHVIPTVEGLLVTVTRLSLDPIFKSLLSRPIFGSPLHVGSGVLAGVVETKRGPCWIVIVPWKNHREYIELILQIWHGFLDICERLVPKIERLCKDIITDPIEIRLDFSNVILPIEPTGMCNQHSDCTPTMSIDHNLKTAEVKLPKQLLGQFMQSENTGEQLVARTIAQAVYNLINNAHESIDDRKLDEIVSSVLGDSGIRVLHVFPHIHPFKGLQMRKNNSVVFLAKEDFVFSKLNLARGCWTRLVDRKIKSKSECNAFLHRVVDKVWRQLYELLGKLDRLSTVRYVLSVHEGILYDREYWDNMARSLSSIYGDTDDIYAITQNRKSDHVNTGISARVILEMAICVCPTKGGRALSSEGLDDLLAKAALLIEVASHSDAIENEMIEPQIEIHPNGEYTLGTDNLSSITTPFSIDYHRKEFDESVVEYDDLYNDHDTTEPNQDDVLFQSELSSALKSEFDITLEQSTDGFRDLLGLAIQNDSLIVETTLGDIKSRLISNCGFSNETAKAFIDTFGYFHRSAWDSPPPGFRKADIYPWRLGRRLSVVTRPILILGPNKTDTVLYGVGTLDLGLSFFLSKFEQGHWPSEECESQEMKEFIGNVNNSMGHSFTRSVAGKYREFGWEVRQELKMTEIGAEAEYGDIDVLAWNKKGNILVIECKRLRLASTITEIAEICTRFCGDENDELSKHLRRVNWITNNHTCLRQIIGFNANAVLIDHRLITNVQVPMTYIKSIPIEPEKIGPLEDVLN